MGDAGDGGGWGWAVVQPRHDREQTTTNLGMQPRMAGTCQGSRVGRDKEPERITKAWGVGEKRGAGADCRGTNWKLGWIFLLLLLYSLPGEVSFVQIAHPCQLGRALRRETWSLPCFSCERMPLLFLSKE